MSKTETRMPVAIETPVTELHEHPSNPRRIEPARMEALKVSMTKNRAMLQVRPLIALPDGTVIMGNQRLKVARILKWETIPCIRVDLDQETAHRWLMIDNNTFGEWDPSLLIDIVRSAKAASKEKLAELGFRPIDIRRILPPSRELDESILESVYHIRIDCENEQDQLEMLGHLAEEGYDVHPLLAYRPRKRKASSPALTDDLSVQVNLTSAIVRSPRVMQVEGLFDLTPEKQDAFMIRADLPLHDQPWNVGLIVGPSGSGKSSVARHLFPRDDASYMWADDFEWDPERSIVDGFPSWMEVSDLGELLSSVGFSSPRAWLRPFGTLSNGEQFRVTIARALAAQAEVTVIDEFTSVVDRVVAKTASWAVSRAARSRGQRMVAITCHEDVLDWLQPDWVFRPAEESFTWRDLQRHPEIVVDVRRTDPSFWPLFRRFHYLNHNLLSGATCFVGFWEGRPVTFMAYTPAYGHPLHVIGSRVVCLPDYQGVGLGTRMADYTAGVLTARGITVHSVASHPARIAHNAASPNWRLTGKPQLQHAQQQYNMTNMGRVGTRASTRLTTSFQYVGPRVDRAVANSLMDEIVHLEADGTMRIMPVEERKKRK